MQLPEPTYTNPRAQVTWLFDRKASTYGSNSTKGNYRSALSFYNEYLDDTSNFSGYVESDPKFYLRDQWSTTSLLKVKKWIERKNKPESDNYRSVNTINSHISLIRQVMTYAYEIGLLDHPVINVALPEGIRETQVRVAYSDSEVETIFELLTPMIHFSKNLLNPYAPTGEGKDPREIDRSGVPRGHPLPKTEGWKSEANMRWYFENEMDCIPVPGTKEHREKHNMFFNSATSKHDGLNRLYRSWGVTALIDQEVIIPLAIKLIAETGLNVESLLSLKRDCFKIAHPLTGQPYLEYRKERSIGDHELHIGLLDSEGMNLAPRPSQVIKSTVEAILELTEPLVHEADNEIQDYLFLYQSSGNRFFGRTRLLNPKALSTWTTGKVEEYDLRADDGGPLSFNLGRFRPTVITELVREGHDLFEVQAIAGHKSLTTTLAYIDRNKVASEYHETISDALRRIKSNLESQTEYPLPIAETEDASPGEFIFRGPICSCKNPYDPPEEVRSSPFHSSGDACTYWNMCLFCENVVLTKESLPKLIAYRMQIQVALDRDLDEIPRAGELYKRAASVIDEVISSDNFFAEEEIEWATGLAESESSEVLDGFIFQGVS